ncbi:MAG: 30S ribosomal [Trebouxia sp. A1-2]|nr:MAG: 30S ribosomal [Trebouxia sp. A1-2]
MGHIRCAIQTIAGPPVKSVRHAGMQRHAISHRPVLLRPRSLVTSPKFSKQLRTPGTTVQSVRKPIVAAATQLGTVKMVVQGRQIELTPSIKQYAEEKVGKAVSHFEGAVKEVDVTLSVSGGDAGHGKRRQRTEITLYTLRNGIVRAEDVEENMYASIDLVCDRLTRKLRKVKDKAIAKGKWQGRGDPKGSSSIKQQEATVEMTDEDSDAEFAEEPEPQTLQPAQASHDSPATHEVMRTKNFFLKPMTVEAAVEQCDQLGHDFYVFRESSSDQVQVVYKRRTTGYGVIVPVNEE